MMVAIAANGDKLPLAIVGKSKNPRCFSLKLSPLPYHSQDKARFNLKVTIWWIKEVFWKYHKEKHGNVNALLLMDNCLAHNGLDEASARER